MYKNSVPFIEKFFCQVFLILDLSPKVWMKSQMRMRMIVILT